MPFLPFAVYLNDMKKITLFFIALLEAAFIFSKDAAYSKLHFSSLDFSGKPVTEEVFSKNKVTMLNVWGTFCPPCIREMPDLAAIDREYASKGLRVIGIPIDIADRNGNVNPLLRSDADKIIERTGASYMHIIPSDEMFSTFLRSVQAIPATFFIDSQGNIIGKMYLGARSKADWQKIIDSLLK